MYLYLWETNISRGSIELDTDLLSAINSAIKHGQQFPEVTKQKIIDQNAKEVCVFRDTTFNGKR